MTVPEENPKKEILAYLFTAVKEGASDIHFISGKKPALRIKDKLISVGQHTPTPEKLKKMLLSLMSEDKREAFAKDKELDFGLQVPNIGRFRVNIFTALNETEAVFRVIKDHVPGNAELGLPDVINKLALKHDGLVLVAGATGSGKSTTLAAMIDYINTNENKRIITVEDPVELIHKNKKSIISQREVGQDTASYERALKSLMRQNPDVILIGEIRDRETADSALQAAQTGHLVLSTVHASSASETIDRFAGLYPMDERPMVKRLLSYSIEGVIAQRLIVDINNKKIPIMEIMTGSKRVRDSILGDANGEPTRESLHDVISSESINGMQTLDQYIASLVVQGQLTAEKAIKEAASPLWMRQHLQQRSLL